MDYRDLLDLVYGAKVKDMKPDPVKREHIRQFLEELQNGQRTLKSENPEKGQ